LSDAGERSDDLTRKRQPSPAGGSRQIAARGARAPKENPGADISFRDTRIEQAQIRTERAEERTGQAKTRTEQAETRTEQAESRTEFAKTRAEQAEIRTEQAETRTELAELRTEEAETALKRALNKEVRLIPASHSLVLKQTPMLAIADRKSPLDQLTSRQRMTLQLIAEGRNTKKIAEILKISPKTVEYHRLKLMDCLHIHDVPGLVRLAMQAGLLPEEKLVAG
jgi:DNA-binding CsgD family transcriptional regulator